MIFCAPAMVAEAGSADAFLDDLEAQRITPGAGAGRLRVWGLKFVLDGGVEAAALEEPYADRPDYSGELMWERADLAAALAAAVRRGWPVGTHAFGDRAVRVLLEAIRDVPGLTGAPVPRGMLVIEHGGLIRPAQIAEAVALGGHITAQQAQLDGLGVPLVAAWGRDPAADLFPWRELLDAGAWISAGTDHPVVPLPPLRCVHGMVTRQTPAGILGPGHAITRSEALRLYTVAGAGFLGTGPGTLMPGAPADLVCYPADPLTCAMDDLPALLPAFTAVAGELVHRPVARFR
jgi:predicted amidohydrolase YtcJ